MDNFGVLLALAGLLADFANERRGAATLSSDDFQAWLQSNRHDDIIKLLRQNSSTVISIKTILAMDRQKLHEQLGRIDRQLAMLLSINLDGFGQLAAAIRPSARLSAEAIKLLQDVDRDGGGRFAEVRAHPSDGGRARLIGLDTCALPIEYSGDARFYDDDVAILLDMGLLRMQLDRGGRIFMITRAACELVAGKTQGSTDG
jgi:hypothetical protein